MIAYQLDQNVNSAIARGLRQRGIAHASIVYAKKGTRTIGEVVEFLELLSQCVEPERMAGKLR